MYPCLLLALVIVSICTLFERIDAMVKVTKFGYQRDMSERCRRRVMPSVFLGRHVVEANSQILHFSQLEVAYSCFITIRTESGSNMIIVIQTEDEPPCVNSATESPVKVFALGETFGGYWGPLPDSILFSHTPYSKRYYTLKTTVTEPQEKENSEGVLDYELSDDYSASAATSPSQEPPHSEQDYIRKMIPIVNITAHLVSSNDAQERAFPIEDTFDVVYDVKPEPGKKYMTSQIPLMQFSMDQKRVSPFRRIGDGTDVAVDGGHDTASHNMSTPEPRFDFEIDLDAFTLDPRLEIPYLSRKEAVLGKKYPPSVNKLTNFKKNKGRMFAVNTLSTALTGKDNIQTEKRGESWKYIEEFLKNLTDSDLEQVHKDSQAENDRFSALLQRVADWQHNHTAYFSPNSSLMVDPLFLEKLQKANILLAPPSTSSVKSVMSSPQYGNIDPIVTSSTEPYETTKSSTRMIKVSAGTRLLSLKSPESYSTEAISISQVTEAAMANIQKVTNFERETSDIILSLGTKDTTNVVSPVNLNKYENDDAIALHTKLILRTSSSTKQSQNTISKEFSVSPYLETEPSVAQSIADHASWKNVVPVAPKMAGMLYRSSVSTKSLKILQKSPSLRSRSTRRRRRRRRRRKRLIQAIAVEPARPHNLTTDPDIPTTPEAELKFEDVQDFAQLVELSDDQIQDHLALRYIRRFVGPTMFDLCKNRQDNMKQHVLFLNTSRIVLALNNFTLKHMTVIATPARWLPFPSQRCEDTLLECQVGGKRVCVDKLVACDGVPNCGATDIYDEDRLQCDDETGLQDNVYLAAFTFLAVFLTLLYTVHYWLKRCVPKVSEAFFIYTDETDNILYLDTIMRSPLDNDVVRMQSQINYFEDIIETISTRDTRKRENFLSKMFRFRFRKKKNIDDFETDVDLMELNKTVPRFSYTETEINNLIRGTGAINIAVQTGASLEMNSDEKPVEFYDSRKFKQALDKEIGSDVQAHWPNVRQSDDGKFDRRASERSELSVLKFLREAKEKREEALCSSMHSKQQKIATAREMELKSTVFDNSQLTSSNESPINYQVPSSLQSFKDPTNPSAAETLLSSLSGATAERRIRFNETLTTIPQEEDPMSIEDIEMIGLSPTLDRQSSSGRDFKRFWTTSKTKKDKRKQRKKLPMHQKLTS